MTFVITLFQYNIQNWVFKNKYNNKYSCKKKKCTLLYTDEKRKDLHIFSSKFLIMFAIFIYLFILWAITNTQCNEGCPCAETRAQHGP